MAYGCCPTQCRVPLVYSQYRLDEQVSNCSMAVCVPSKATCRSTCGQQAKLHNTGLVIYWRCFLKSLLFWYRLKPMYPDTHDMVYDTSQSQIDRPSSL